MATIQYTITGRYEPFGVELIDTDTDSIIRTTAHLDKTPDGEFYEFTGIPTGNYKLVVYDSIGGVEEFLGLTVS